MAAYTEETKRQKTKKHLLYNTLFSSLVTIQPGNPFRLFFRLLKQLKQGWHFFPQKNSQTPTNHPSSIIHHPSSIIHHPSSIIRHPSSVIHHPSSTTIIIIIIIITIILIHHLVGGLKRLYIRFAPKLLGDMIQFDRRV